MLSGKRILAVEDEALIAVMLEDMLSDLGVVTVGPAGTVTSALALAQSETFDAAILDVNLRGERIDPVAAVLAERAIPFVFVTGYGEVRIDGQPHAPVIDKPYTQDKLAKALSQILKGNGASAPLQRAGE